jgi:hypothetical protein
MFFSFAIFKNFKVYQLDVKSAFSNGDLEEEVYIEQTKGFLLSENECYFFILNKSLYVLNKAPKAWYSILDKYLQHQSLKKETTDKNIYINIGNAKMLIIVVYVDDIIFGSNDVKISENFVE